MCLAVPARILEIEGEMAKVDYGGVRKEARIDMVDASVGDYVLVHAGFAIEIVDEEQALQSIDEISRLLENDG
ncbi:MAG: HypC/HybG/HupF family hydrogenase formation chaperone [Candidatus Woesearchaeota archaeon]